MISAVCGGNLANCGIALYNSAGAQIIGCDIISSVMSVATFLGPEQGVVNMSCNELLCDGLRDRGDLLGSRGGVVASFHSRSGEVSGLVINGGSRPIIIDTLSLTNCHFLTNWYDGVEILCNAKNIAFIGCQFSGNGFGSPGNYNGLLAYGSAGIGGLSIIGDRANGGLWEGWPIVQGNGVNLGGRISPLTIQGVHTYDRQLDSPYHSAAGSAAGVSRDRTAARGSPSVPGANSSPAVSADADNTAAQFGSSSVSQ